MSKFFFLDPLKEIQFIDEHNQGISFQNQDPFFQFSKKNKGDSPLPTTSCAFINGGFCQNS